MRTVGALNSRLRQTLAVASSLGRHPLWLTICMIVIFSALLHLSISPLNPDWLSYQIIYQFDGVWLSEQGRDPAFLAFNSLISSVIGPDAYELYRVVLASYFLIFVAVVTFGLIFTIHARGWGCVALGLALTFLGFTRFTIQIREGIAVTLIVFGMACFAKAAHRLSPRASNTRAFQRALRSTGGWCFLVTAAFIHISAAFLCMIAVAAWWLAHRETGNKFALKRLWTIWAVSIGLAALAVLQLIFGGALESLISDTAGDRLVEIKPLNALQLVLWSLYGLACWTLSREMRVNIRTGVVSGMYAAFLQILAGPATAVTLGSIVVGLLMSVSPLFITNYVRLLDLFLALSLLSLAAVGERHLRLIFVGIFLMANQIRAITDSISIYFGVNLL